MKSKKFELDDHLALSDENVGSLGEFVVAAQATETKSLVPTEKDIYEGLFNIATGFGVVHGITEAEASAALAAHHTEKAMIDVDEIAFSQPRNFAQGHTPAISQSEQRMIHDYAGGHYTRCSS